MANANHWIKHVARQGGIFKLGKSAQVLVIIGNSGDAVLEPESLEGTVDASNNSRIMSISKAKGSEYRGVRLKRLDDKKTSNTIQFIVTKRLEPLKDIKILLNMKPVKKGPASTSPANVTFVIGTNPTTGIQAAAQGNIDYTDDNSLTSITVI